MRPIQPPARPSRRHRRTTASPGGADGGPLVPLVTTALRTGLRRCAGTASPVLRRVRGRPVPGSAPVGSLRLGRWAPLRRPTWSEVALRGERREAVRRAGSPAPTARGVSALVVLADLRAVLAVTFLPLADAVAVLDTTSASWSLELDSDSSAEDQYWAMTDALRVLRHGAAAAEHAAVGSSLQPLRLVAGGPATGD